MSQVRINALNALKAIDPTTEANGKLRQNSKISELYNLNVFSQIKMREHLPKEVYEEVVSALHDKAPVPYQVANTVANAMKSWAIEQGVTHFTHWFQPLTSKTAEKHDAFYKPSMNPELFGIEKLTGWELVQREPDASSFPNGGLRNTHMARGYTIWDPSSPAFIMESDYGRTLYIPTVFVSYTGECLDYKGPLLKSVDKLDGAVRRVLKLFGKAPRRAVANLGWEQEYFLVDAELAKSRPDLLLSGRTLFGAPSAKGQDKSDHYFGAIPGRVQKFMHHFELEALKLGVPVLTRHNEVAPGQYEVAPMYEEVNQSVDHNLLVMNVMQEVANKHNLRVLFHEKPFNELNGSGKHNNWSIGTSDGENLLKPGKTPSQNLQFLTFFISTIKAIDTYGDLLRTSIASAGNDHRMGGHEAPPAIMSVFTGSYLEKVLDAFEKDGLNASVPSHESGLTLEIPFLPEAKLDNTDRNRTSPFPFTGNKFEFRAVGSNATCSEPMCVMNTIVAKTLNDFADRVEKAGGNEEAIVKELQKDARAAKRSVFNGDGYSEEWAQEAKKRGLKSVMTTPEALQFYLDDKVFEVFEGVLSKQEIHARVNVFADNYRRDIETEARLYHDIATSAIIPAALKQQQDYLETIEGYEDVDVDATGLKENVKEIARHIDTLSTYARKVRTALNDAIGIE
ncbi:MAG: glutamine synthetase III, partial [Bacteroidota bacterium]